MSKKYNIIILIIIILSISLIYFILFLNKHERLLKISFLDIGQGDAMLIQTPFQQNILIDGGDGEQIIQRLSEELSWWDNTIDLMILTHPHSDHVGGLIKVLQNYKVKQILYTGAVHNTPDYLAWLRLIKKQRIFLKIINHPQIIKLGTNLNLDIIYPQRQLDIDSNLQHLNNTSIVAKLIYKQKSFLFTGDAEQEVEDVLLSTGINLRADVLKIGHHGSDTSTTNNFLQAVSPSYAIIEVGQNNPFHHPSPRIIRRLERKAIKLFRTDQDKTIHIFSNGHSLLINK